MLVGVGGSGKQSLARLAGHICGYSTCTITISGSYTINNFKEDIQKMYKRAGIKAWADLGCSDYNSLVISLVITVIIISDLVFHSLN